MAGHSHSYRPDTSAQLWRGTAVNPTHCQNRNIDLPTTTDLCYPQRLSSCIHRLDRHQLPTTIVQLHSTTRPTSAACNDRPAAFNDSTDLSYPQRSSGCILRLDRHQLPATIVQVRTSTTPPYQLPTSPIKLKTQILLPRTLHHACKHDNKLSSLLYLLPHFCFLHSLWLSLLARFNLNHLRGRHAYRLRNTVIYDMFEARRPSPIQQYYTSKRKCTPTRTMEINPKRQTRGKHEDDSKTPKS